MAKWSNCRWVERDGATGRPKCVHGWAVKSGPYWTCPLKKFEQMRKYRSTDKGKAANARHAATDSARSSKALYELTRRRLIR